MQDVYRHIEAHADESMELLAELVRQPSVSAHRLGFDKAPELMRRVLQDAGFRSEIVPVQNDGLPSVFGVQEGTTDRTLLFYTHYDVQPPDPLELWESGPFEPERRGDRLYGRGASDDKGNIVARLAAIRAFKEVRGELPCTVKFFAEGEEESGSKNLPGLIEDRGEEFKADACIWESGSRTGDGTPLVEMGLKGVLCVQFTARRMVRDAHSASATILPSATWRLVQALNTIKGPDDRCQIPGFYDEMRSPTSAEEEAVAGLPDDSADLQETFEVDSFIGGLTGVDLRQKHLLEPTANIAGLIGGYTGPGMKTVLPAEATAKMDFRLVPDMRPDDIFGKLRAHLDRHGFTDVETEMIGAVSPARTPVDSPWAKLVASTATEVYGQPAAVSPSMAGSGPMYEFGVLLGMPIATAGVGHPSHNVHSPNENVSIEDFLLGTKHVALIMERFARGQA